jgi:hypothetical protein
MKEPYEKGLAIYSASSLALRQRTGGVGILDPKCCKISISRIIKKAPTFAIGCDCSDRQPSEKERLL